MDYIWVGREEEFVKRGNMKERDLTQEKKLDPAMYLGISTCLPILNP